MQIASPLATRTFASERAAHELAIRAWKGLVDGSMTEAQVQEQVSALRPKGTNGEGDGAPPATVPTLPAMPVSVGRKPENTSGAGVVGQRVSVPSMPLLRGDNLLRGDAQRQDAQMRSVTTPSMTTRPVCLHPALLSPWLHYGSVAVPAFGKLLSTGSPSLQVRVIFSGDGALLATGPAAPADRDLFSRRPSRKAEAGKHKALGELVRSFFAAIGERALEIRARPETQLSAFYVELLEHLQTEARADGYLVTVLGAVAGEQSALPCSAGDLWISRESAVAERLRSLAEAASQDDVSILISCSLASDDGL
jgi:hypothetical protein